MAIIDVHQEVRGSMRKTKAAREEAKKITQRKLGRTVLRPLRLVELESVAGGDTEPPHMGVVADGVEYWP